MKRQRLRNRTMTVALVGALLLALGAAQAMAQGIPIIFCAQQEPQTPECVGTDSFESLVGQDTRDVIRAFAGNDIVNAQGGNDDAFGGPGVDNINGKFGNDALSGGSGLDTVSDGVMENGSCRRVTSTHCAATVATTSSIPKTTTSSTLSTVAKVVRTEPFST